MTESRTTQIADQWRSTAPISRSQLYRLLDPTNYKKSAGQMGYCHEAARRGLTVVTEVRKCRAAWQDHCRRIHAREKARELARASLKVEQAPEGSLAYAQMRDDIAYLTGTRDSPSKDGSERERAWRWAGILIFLSFCSGGGFLMLKHMQLAALEVGDRLKGWKAPFFGIRIRLSCGTSSQGSMAV